jgi:hypothetical protein
VINGLVACPVAGMEWSNRAMASKKQAYIAVYPLILTNLEA